MMPQWAYMHIAGQDASEYLSPGLVQFARATDTYFSMGNKFRNPTVAPTHDVTTDRSQRLMLRFVPVDREDNTYSYKVRYTLAVGDNRVLDMASTFFDIRGCLIEVLASSHIPAQLTIHWLLRARLTHLSG